MWQIASFPNLSLFTQIMLLYIIINTEKIMDKSQTPKILYSIKHYNKEMFFSDLVAGIIVAIIALPLSIALGIASGVGPNEGLYTAIVAGFIISFLGGSLVQISGPTAAFSTIVATTIATYGMDTLIVSTLVAGILLIIAGYFQLGKYISKIPAPIVTGFTAGVAMNIVVGQLKDFFGLTYIEGTKNITSMDKILAFINHINTINVTALLIGLFALILIILLPKVLKKIPESLIAIIITTLIVIFFKLPILKINDLYTISNKPMSFHMPDFSLLTHIEVYTNGFIIAMIIAIESLLSCVVSDKMINDTHHPNAEIFAQGIGNIFSVLFGGIPATGALARTTANVNNGGKTPIAGMIHSVTLFLILIGLMKYVGLIPMPVIAALLFIVAFNMMQIKVILNYIKKGDKSDLLILFTCFFFTFFINLVVGIAISLTLWILIYQIKFKK